MPKRVDEKVEKDPLDLVWREARGRVGRPERLEPNAARGCLGCEATEAALDHRPERRFPQFERERAGLDLRELEEIVDELGEDAHLLTQRRKVVLRLGEAVFERLEHRLHAGEGRAEIVARPGDELASRVEDPLEGIAPSR